MEPPLQIVITGASSGIGAALTQNLAADGHNTYVCARRGEKLKTITQNGSIAQWRICDVSRENEVSGFSTWVNQQTGHIDALINCAAAFDAIGPLWETDSDDWWNTIKTNLFGTYLTVKAFIPLLKQSKRPHIINFAGGGAFHSFPNYSAYAISKAGIVRMTENLAVELQPYGIRVNAIAPGFVATEIHEATLRVGPDHAGLEHYQRTQQLVKEGAIPMDVPVSCVRFLLSPQSKNLTGKTLSASFDPWSTATFQSNIEAINRMDIYTLRRINLTNLPEEPICKELATAADNNGTKR